MNKVVSESGHKEVQGSQIDLKYIATLFTLVCIGIFLVLIPELANGRFLIWRGDGLSMYVNSLAAMGLMLRRSVRSLIAGKGLASQEFLTNLGYGTDTINVIPFQDPLNWLAIFVPAAYTEYLYYALVVIRMLFAALTFSLYCIYKRGSKYGSICGSLVYVFAGYALFWGLLRHPQFLNILYILPVILIGVEQIFNRRGIWIFVFSLAYSFALSPYFSYMAAIFIAVYCVLKWFFCVEQRNPIGFVKYIAGFIGLGVLALLISAFSSLPIVLQLVSIDRLQTETFIPLLFDKSLYATFMAGALGAPSNLDSARLFIGPAAVVTCIIFIACKRRFERRIWLAWTIGVALATISAMVPYLEHVIHGFSYVTNRWFFIADFVLAYIVNLSVPAIKDLSKREWGFVAVGVLLCVAWALLSLAETSYPVWLICVIMLLIIATVVLKRSASMGGASYSARAFCALSLASVAIVGLSVSGTGNVGLGYAKEFVELGSVNSFYHAQNPYSIMDSVDKSERAAWRYSFPNLIDGAHRNESIFLKRNILNCYSNPYSQPVWEMRNELGVADISFANWYAGSDARLALDTLSGAKYYIVSENQSWRVPASYTFTGVQKNGWELYETNLAVPIGFVMDSTIPHDSYLNLNMVERQEAMLNALVLPDDISANNDKAHALRSTSTVLSDQPIPVGDAKINANKVYVAGSESKLRFEFAGISDAEYYLVVEGLSITDWQSVTPPGSFQIATRSDMGERTVTQNTPASVQFCGKDSWAINLGWSHDKAIDGVDVSFSVPGTYTYDAMYVIAQPIKPITSALEKRVAKGMSSITINANNNEIYAKATTYRDLEYGVFSVAYSDGWKAFVDGRRVETFAGDTGFVAFPIEGAGSHEVRIAYSTPGRAEGLGVSCVSLFIAWIVGVLYKRRTDSTRRKNP